MAATCRTPASSIEGVSLIERAHRCLRVPCLCGSDRLCSVPSLSFSGAGWLVGYRPSLVVQWVHVMRVRMNVLFVYCFSVTSHVSSLSRRSSLVAVGVLNKNRAHINAYRHIRIRTYTHTYIDTSTYVGSVTYVWLSGVRGFL